MIKNVLAAIGAVVLFLALCSAAEIGHFRLYYNPNPINCTIVGNK